MVSKAIILISLSVLSQAATVCPIFACSPSLSANVCTNRVSSVSFQINSNGCNSNFQCSLNDVWAWASLSATSILACVAVPTQTTTTTVAWTNVACSTQQANKGFKNGNTVVKCAVDTDCQLADGTNTVCDCAFRSDGAGICTPDVSNSAIFGGYWTSCGTTNQITSQNAYLYWTSFIANWVNLQSDIACNSIFVEIQNLNILYAAFTGSEALIAGALSLLVLLY